ncbi:hypothetical protein [Qipengyuania citrea]|uniref:hypothetical protein n=1 Tax=Qipengyuania citrea TaxID=225971 RepID=UPI001E2F8C83|nr:hypothetical protein [Qipengyuania citrea]
MSKIGISARIAAIMEAAENIDPMAARIHRLPPALRARYETWRTECARIMDEAGDPAAAYDAYLDSGTWGTPDPPRDVAAALELQGAPVLTVDMSAQQVADVWKVMVDA